MTQAPLREGGSSHGHKCKLNVIHMLKPTGCVPSTFHIASLFVRMQAGYCRPVDEEDLFVFFFFRTSVPSSLTVQALTDSLLFGHRSQGNGEVGAAFLCPSRNRTQFLALFSQIGCREGGFGAEMRKMVPQISERSRDIRNKLKEES